MWRAHRFSWVNEREWLLRQQRVYLNRWSSFPWRVGTLAPLFVEWVDPQDVTMKLPEEAMLGLLTQRQWPLEANFDPLPYAETIKFLSVQARITHGVPWAETPIFEVYRRRLERGESVKGHRDLQLLSEAYEARFSALVRAMSAGGFSTATLRALRPTELPWAFKSQSGSLWFGNQGNHRLSIAKVIGLEAFPIFHRFHHCGSRELDRDRG
jgi:hypothetical protein